VGFWCLFLLFSLQQDFLICLGKEIISPVKPKCGWGCSPPWLHEESFLKNTAPESLVLVFDPFQKAKHSGNFGSGVGRDLLKWNLMSSEWKCLVFFSGCFEFYEVSPFLLGSLFRVRHTLRLVRHLVESIIRSGPKSAPASHRDLLLVRPST
jgi:hypothetical protein